MCTISTRREGRVNFDQALLRAVIISTPGRANKPSVTEFGGSKLAGPLGPHPLSPSPFGRGGTTPDASFPLSALAERGSGGEALPARPRRAYIAHNLASGMQWIGYRFREVAAQVQEWAISGCRSRLAADRAT